MLKRTPLFDVYRTYEGSKFIDFGGWELPVQFSRGIVAEHQAVRNGAGLFDVSHMGEILVEGSAAELFLDRLLTNRIEGMEDGRVVYSPMCYEHGGVVDDLLVYRRAPGRYLLVVNASNTDIDFEWISGRAAAYDHTDLVVVNVSDRYAQIALQGPLAEHVLSGIAGERVKNIGFFRFVENMKAAGVNAIISRTGYTGEDGFEIYTSPEDAPVVWNALLGSSRSGPVIPCGLGARDTLRFEAKLPLYGHEISESINPLEAGLSYFIDFSKSDFCGKEALQTLKENGIKREIRGVEMIEKGVPRHGYPVHKNDRIVGHVTTGAKSITRNAFMALVIVERGLLRMDDECGIEINGRVLRGRIVKTPFYKNTKGSEKSGTGASV